MNGGSGWCIPGRLLITGLFAGLLGLVLATGLAAQADPQARERDRLDLGRLAEGPAIIGGGIVVGEPSGLTGKLWYTETGFAVDTAVAWSFQDNPGLYLHTNGLFHLAIIETAGGRYLSPFLGAGLSYRIGDKARVGLRVPLGLSILPFRAFPAEFFAELAPGIGLVPDTSPTFGAGIGMRFYMPF
ncbi:MAG: hypothetical protein EA427_00840 [Spirochaetaceae bacterium]|nr:MAG: hypothetical protein EA427_00840 [Spirochaetaceae bacterium]